MMRTTNRAFLCPAATASHIQAITITRHIRDSCQYTPIILRFIATKNKHSVWILTMLDLSTPSAWSMCGMGYVQLRFVTYGVVRVLTRFGVWGWSLWSAKRNRPYQIKRRINYEKACITVGIADRTRECFNGVCWKLRWGRSYAHRWEKRNQVTHTYLF